MLSTPLLMQVLFEPLLLASSILAFVYGLLKERPTFDVYFGRAGCPLRPGG